MTLRGEKTLARLERQRAKFRARFAAGQCVHGLCPLPVFRGGRCITHRTRLLQLQRARAAALKRAGICVRCTEEKARRGYVTCAACARVLALKDRERRRRTRGNPHARRIPVSSSSTPACTRDRTRARAGARDLRERS